MNGFDIPGLLSFGNIWLFWGQENLWGRIEKNSNSMNQTYPQSIDMQIDRELNPCQFDLENSLLTWNGFWIIVHSGNAVDH